MIPTLNKLTFRVPLASKFSRSFSNLIPLKHYLQDRPAETAKYYSNNDYALKVQEERVSVTLNGFNKNTTYNDLLRVLGPVPAHNLDYIVTRADLLPTGVYLFSVPNEEYFLKLEERIKSEFNNMYRLYRRKDFNIITSKTS